MFTLWSPTLTDNQTNKYLQLNEPWALAKRRDVKTVIHADGESSEVDLNQKKVERIVFYSAESVRIVGILLQPFMPDKASQLLDMLGVDKSRRGFDDAKIGADDSYGTPQVPLGKCAYDGLFPPLPVET